MGLYTNINGVYREVKEAGTSIDGVNKDLKKVYCRIENTDRNIFDWFDESDITGLVITYGYCVYSTYSGTTATSEVRPTTPNECNNYFNLSWSTNSITVGQRAQNSGPRLYMYFNLSLKDGSMIQIRKYPELYEIVSRNLALTGTEYVTATIVNSSGSGGSGSRGLFYRRGDNESYEGAFYYMIPSDNEWETIAIPRPNYTPLRYYYPSLTYGDIYIGARSYNGAKHIYTTQVNFSSATWGGRNIPLTINLNI